MLNRCACCGKFKSWDQLNYQCDREYDGEEDEYHFCDSCLEAQELALSYYSSMQNVASSRIFTRYTEEREQDRYTKLLDKIGNKHIAIIDIQNKG